MANHILSHTDPYTELQMYDSEGTPYKLFINLLAISWYFAAQCASQCRDGGYNNWILPNRQELLRLFDLYSGQLPHPEG